MALTFGIQDWCGVCDYSQSTLPYPYHTFLTIVQAVLFNGIFYPMLGFIGSAGSFFYYLCMTFLYLCYYVSLGSVSYEESTRIYQLYLFPDLLLDFYYIMGTS